MCCGFARDLSRQNRLLSPGRLEDGSCLNLNNCLPAGGVQAPCKTVVGSRNRSQILFAQKKDRSWNFGTGKAGQVDREPTNFGASRETCPDYENRSKEPI